MADRKNIEDGIQQERTAWEAPCREVIREKQADGSFRLRLDVKGTTSTGQEKLVISEYLTGLRERVIESNLKITQELDRQTGLIIEDIINERRSPVSSAS